ncbi:MAG: flagellar hook-length control protein FliK, partial [Actinomycetota bacterium]|nr:flagellar hook-length control protein FliK [Actinomycetota bacterium]
KLFFSYFIPIVNLKKSELFLIKNNGMDSGYFKEFCFCDKYLENIEMKSGCEDIGTATSGKSILNENSKYKKLSNTKNHYHADESEEVKQVNSETFINTGMKNGKIFLGKNNSTANDMPVEADYAAGLKKIDSDASDIKKESIINKKPDLFEIINNDGDIKNLQKNISSMTAENYKTLKNFIGEKETNISGNEKYLGESEADKTIKSKNTSNNVLPKDFFGKSDNRINSYEKFDESSYTAKSDLTKEKLNQNKNVDNFRNGLIFKLDNSKQMKGLQFKVSDSKDENLGNGIANFNNQIFPDKSFLLNQILNLQKLNNVVFNSIRYCTRNEVNEIKLNMDPEYLGKLTIKIASRNKKVDILIEASVEYTNDLLQKNVQMLKDSLGEKGVDINQITINLENQASQNEQDLTYLKHEKRQEGVLNNAMNMGLSNGSVEAAMDISSIWNGNSYYLNKLV